MTRGTWVYRNGKVVPKCGAEHRRADGKQFHVISDDLGQDLEHHGFSDGRKTSSKSVFRRWTKEIGAVEKGNDREAPRYSQDTSMKADVARAIQMVREGYRPMIGKEW